MIEIDISELWQAAAILLGLQATSFNWRIQQEAAVADRGDIKWLPPADWINLIAMMLCVALVFALPAIGLVDVKFARMAFGLIAILVVGHSFALAGHYELFTQGKRTYRYFPPQEKWAVFLIAIVACAYIAFWAGGANLEILSRR